MYYLMRYRYKIRKLLKRKIAKIAPHLRLLYLLAVFLRGDDEI
jgi:hypothetical protein